MKDFHAPMTQHAEQHHTEETPLSVSHFVHTLREYRPAMLLSLAAVMLLYAIAALVVYLTAATARVTSLPFRLDFEGAGDGQYPNDTKFSPAEIVAAPILLKVYQANDLGNTVTFPNFRNSIFILESNREYESLAADYGARLSDPKLNPVDRERIQREFELKRASLSKNDYSINYRSTAKSKVPAALAPKILSDILAVWADRAIREQHVGAYRVSVLSPAIIDAGSSGGSEPVSDLQILRTRIMQIITNIDELADIPATELVRTNRERLSLAEIKLRLEEIVRFRLEPLVPVARDVSSANSAEVVNFVETQLSYDERRLARQREEANAIRDALTVYSVGMRSPAAEQNESGQPERRTPDRPIDVPETVVPQISESFIDRLVTLTKNSADTEYRQKLVTDLRVAMLKLTPLEDAVAYDHRMLEQMRAGTGRGGNAAAVRAQIESIRTDVKGLLTSINEIYQIASSHLVPSTQLFSSGTPLTRAERTVSFERLGLYGLLVFLIAIPVIVFFALLHNRVREEEAEEHFVTTVPASES